MKILQHKRTPIAWADEAISNVLNTYTNIISDNYRGRDIPEGYDIVHFHNQYVNYKGRQLIQYHSEPEKVDFSFKGVRLVISQYHATLPEYKDCIIVRNPINFETELYEPRTIDGNIKIGYSPSKTISIGDWNDKGYEQVKRILMEVHSETGADFDIINGVPLQECIERKSQCHIIIDECMTTSFHRSALEGLALGKLTICSIGKKVEDVFKKASGSSTIPFMNVWMSGLKDCLLSCIHNGLDYINEIGRSNRIWMENYWHPSVIANEYKSIYEYLMNDVR